MKFDEYLKIDRLSNSDMKHLKISIEQYQKRHELAKETAAMRFGRMVHKYILENEDFFNDYDISDLNKNTKAFKELNETTDKELITSGELDTLISMQSALKAHPKYNAIGFDEVEKTVLFDYYDMECKARLDIVDKTRIIWDLKTIDNIERVSNNIINFEYYRQAAFYKLAQEITTGRMHNFIFIFIQKTPPYSVRFVQLDQLFIEYGILEIRDLIDKLKNYIPGSYTGYSSDIELLEIPGWYSKKLDNEIVDFNEN